MNLLLFDAILRLYEQNFRNLHWNSAGMEFNDSHKDITTGYYEMISKDVDDVAEILHMLNVYPLNYIEAANMIMKAEKQYYVVNSSTNYSRGDICKAADIMLRDICEMLAEIIQALEDPLDAGIKSFFEDMLFRYTKEARYLNKRRLTPVSGEE